MIRLLEIPEGTLEVRRSQPPAHAHRYLPTPAPSWTVDITTYINSLPLQTAWMAALLCGVPCRTHSLYPHPGWDKTRRVFEGDLH